MSKWTIASVSGAATTQSARCDEFRTQWKSCLLVCFEEEQKNEFEKCVGLGEVIATLSINISEHLCAVSMLRSSTFSLTWATYCSLPFLLFYQLKTKTTHRFRCPPLRYIEKGAHRARVCLYMSNREHTVSAWCRKCQAEKRNMDSIVRAPISLLSCHADNGTVHLCGAILHLPFTAYSRSI